MWQDSGTVRDALTRGGADLRNYDTLRAQGKYADLIKVIDKIIPRTGTADHLFKDTTDSGAHSRLRENVELHASLAKAFRLAAFTTGGVMLGSVIAIPFAHIACSMDVLAWHLLLVGLIGFAICLYMYWVVIQAALHTQ